MAVNPTTRRGNGSGWGGPAKGAGLPINRKKFESGHTLSVGHGHPTLTVMEATKARDLARAQQLKDHLFSLATGAEREDTQVRAAEAWLNRQEGMPVARNLNLNINEVSGLTDADLDAEIARLAGTTGSAGGDVAGEKPQELPPGSGGVVH